MASDPLEQSVASLNIALQELASVSTALRGGADFYDKQLAGAADKRGVVDSVKEYIAQVLDSTVQHLTNAVERFNDASDCQKAQVAVVDTDAAIIAKRLQAARVMTEHKALQLLQEPARFQRLPKTYNPADCAVEAATR
ncbi:hypothetical protein WJX72_002717 [[Myrmecia] bisecta]|uniref:Uncharacterized protein n=1 Tax=[Myrmecia] bisecta TaxID=41462 RepID=A0AAW1QPP1_9CHLO